jgi:hypothetical protein
MYFVGKFGHKYVLKRINCSKSHASKFEQAMILPTGNSLWLIGLGFGLWGLRLFQTWDDQWMIQVGNHAACVRRHKQPHDWTNE